MRSNPPSSPRNHALSHGGTQHQSNNFSQHPCLASHSACDHDKWALNNDVSQDHDIDNWSLCVHLDVPVDYITIFNEEY